MSLTYSGLLTQLAEHIGVDASSLLAQQVLRIGELDIFLQQGRMKPRCKPRWFCASKGRPAGQAPAPTIHQPLTYSLSNFNLAIEDWVEISNFDIEESDGERPFFG